jgi:dihydroxyacetone kinase
MCVCVYVHSFTPGVYVCIPLNNPQHTQARAKGIKCEMVIVADDVAEYGSSVSQQRGLAGTVFVHKV